MVNVKLGIVGGDVVTTASDESGDAPRAFTIDELRDVVMGLTGDDDDKGNSFKLLVIDRVLEALQMEYLNFYTKPAE